MSVKSPAQTVKHSSSISQIIRYHPGNLSDTPAYSKVNHILPTLRSDGLTLEGLWESGLLLLGTSRTGLGFDIQVDILLVL